MSQILFHHTNMDTQTVFEQQLPGLGSSGRSTNARASGYQRKSIRLTQQQLVKGRDMRQTLVSSLLLNRRSSIHYKNGIDSEFTRLWEVGVLASDGSSLPKLQRSFWLAHSICLEWAFQGASSFDSRARVEYASTMTMGRRALDATSSESASEFKQTSNISRFFVVEMKDALVDASEPSQTLSAHVVWTPAQLVLLSHMIHVVIQVVSEDHALVDSSMLDMEYYVRACTKQARDDTLTHRLCVGAFSLLYHSAYVFDAETRGEPTSPKSSRRYAILELPLAFQMLVNVLNESHPRNEIHVYARFAIILFGLYLNRTYQSLHPAFAIYFKYALDMLDLRGKWGEETWSEPSAAREGRGSVRWSDAPSSTLSSTSEQEDRKWRSKNGLFRILRAYAMMRIGHLEPARAEYAQLGFHYAPSCIWIDFVRQKFDSCLSDIEHMQNVRIPEARSRKEIPVQDIERMSETLSLIQRACYILTHRWENIYQFNFDAINVNDILSHENPRAESLPLRVNDEIFPYALLYIRGVFSWMYSAKTSRVAAAHSAYVDTWLSGLRDVCKRFHDSSTFLIVFRDADVGHAELRQNDYLVTGLLSSCLHTMHGEHADAREVLDRTIEFVDHKLKSGSISSLIHPVRKWKSVLTSMTSCGRNLSSPSSSMTRKRDEGSDAVDSIERLWVIPYLFHEHNRLASHTGTLTQGYRSFQPHYVRSNVQGYTGTYVWRKSVSLLSMDARYVKWIRRASLSSASPKYADPFIWMPTAHPSSPRSNKTISNSPMTLVNTNSELTMKLESGDVVAWSCMAVEGTVFFGVSFTPFLDTQNIMEPSSYSALYLGEMNQGFYSANQRGVFTLSWIHPSEPSSQSVGKVRYSCRKQDRVDVSDSKVKEEEEQKDGVADGAVGKEHLIQTVSNPSIPPEPARPKEGTSEAEESPPVHMANESVFGEGIKDNAARLPKEGMSDGEESPPVHLANEDSPVHLKNESVSGGDDDDAEMHLL